MKTFGWVVCSILCLAVLLSLAFGLEWLGIGWRGYFGPKREAVKREVFEQTLSYNRGKEQELSRYYLQYQRAEDREEREAIAATIRHAFGAYDETNINSPTLRAFLASIKAGQ